MTREAERKREIEVKGGGRGRGEGRPAGGGSSNSGVLTAPPPALPLLVPTPPRRLLAWSHNASGQRKRRLRTTSPSDAYEALDGRTPECNHGDVQGRQMSFTPEKTVGGRSGKGRPTYPAPTLGPNCCIPHRGFICGILGAEASPPYAHMTVAVRKRVPWCRNFSQEKYA